MRYGKAVKRIRSLKGLSQRQLAALLECTQSYVSLVEQGHKEPSLTWIKTFSDRLGVPVMLTHLLASEPEDRKGLTDAQTGVLGDTLLRALLETEEEDGEKKSA